MASKILAVLDGAGLDMPIAATAQKVTLVFRGAGDCTALNHWLQTTPQAGGTVLACARNDGTNDGINGPAFVVGGPYAGYGAGGSNFSNMLAVVDGAGILTPYNGTYGGWGFFGVAEAALPNWAVMSAAVPPASSSVPKMSDWGNITNQWPIGAQMPDCNNNDNCDVGRGSCEGLAQNGLAGAPVAYAFYLPSGHSYTPTYTGSLTHTVTLL